MLQKISFLFETLDFTPLQLTVLFLDIFLCILHFLEIINVSVEMDYVPIRCLCDVHPGCIPADSERVAIYKAERASFVLQLAASTSAIISANYVPHPLWPGQ